MIESSNMLKDVIAVRFSMNGYCSEYGAVLCVQEQWYPDGTVIARRVIGKKKLKMNHSDIITEIAK